METCHISPCDHSYKETIDRCHPYLRTNFRSYTPAGETSDESCLQKPLPCNSCCIQGDGQKAFEKCSGKSLHYGQTTKTGKPEDSNNHLRGVSHSCPLGTIVCCSNRSNNACDLDKHIIKASDPYSQPNGNYDQLEHRDDSGLEEVSKKEERPCCAKRTSWTEPRMCRCDVLDPVETSKRCECECGATIAKESKRKEKKKVRFSDQVTAYDNVDCDKAFRNLREEDVKELCSCCKECAVKGKEQCVGKPVLVYELPEPKFEGTSVTHDDFCWQKTPQIEVPPWHPNIKDRWRHMDVPSLSETTYQGDYKPPPVFHAERDPVYLAPQREKKGDPCQELAEEYSTWKKTSTGPAHVYHSSCDTCDRDLHRVHLHECNVAHLPPQFQCHGDGHICEPPHHTVGKFTLCETGDAEKSRYWWQRTCGEPDKYDTARVCELPPDLLKSACPNYTTCYKHDYRDPKKLEKEKNDCSACEYCTNEPSKDPPSVLCTKDPNQPLITQRAGVI